MALVNHAKSEINAKIVYYGPGLSGKGTNLNHIYRKLKPEHRGKLKTMNVGRERMLFFDFAPAVQGKVGDFNVRFHVYSITGEVTENTAWKMVLKGVDGLVFVADSDRQRMKANNESLEELRRIMRSYGMSVKDLPGVLQCNKRDIVDPVPVGEMESALNYGGFTVIPTIAAKGEGVLESLFNLMKRVLANLSESGVAPGAEFDQTSIPEAAPAMAEEKPLEMEPVMAAPTEEPPIPPAPADEGSTSGAAMEPVIELAGEPEQLAVGRLRLPLRIRCGDTVKEVPLVITVGLEPE